MSKWDFIREDLASYISLVNTAQIGIEKLIKILEGEAEEQFNAEQYMSLYT